MPVETVNGHVLLPQYPDWDQKVRWGRSWQTEVGRSVAGGELRRALRPKPRPELTWQVTPRDVSDQSRLLAILAAASKAGLACAPYWGRGLRVVEAAGTDLELELPAWSWLQAGDWLLLRRPWDVDPDACEVAEVESVAEARVVLTGDLAANWPTPSWVWPLVFGRFSAAEASHRSNWHCAVSITLRQFVVRPDPPAYEDICFLNPWGGQESWRNYPDQAWPAQYPETFTLQAQEFACFGAWNAGFFGTFLYQESFPGVSEFSVSDFEVLIVSAWTTNHGPVPSSSSWRAEFYGLRGGADTFASLLDGAVTPAWSGPTAWVNPTLPGLWTWTGAPFGDLGVSDCWDTLPDGAVVSPFTATSTPWGAVLASGLTQWTASSY